MPTTDELRALIEKRRGLILNAADKRNADPALIDVGPPAAQGMV